MSDKDKKGQLNMDYTELHQLFKKRDEGKATALDLKRIEELQEMSWKEDMERAAQALWDAGEWSRKAGVKALSMEDKL